MGVRSEAGLAGDPVSSSDGIVQNTPSSRRVLVWTLIVAQLFAALLLLATRGDEADENDFSSLTSDEQLKRGFAEQALGRTEDAEQAYAQVLAEDPGNELANYNLGVIEHKKGNGDKAETYYRKALSSDPNFIPALFNLAIRREAVGAPEEAEDLYRKIIGLDAGMAKAHLNLGFVLLRKLDRPDEGKQEILKAIELDSTLASRVTNEELASPTPG